MKTFISIALSLFLFFTLAFLLAERAGWMEEAHVTEFIQGIRATPGGLVAAALVIGGLLTVDLLLPVPSSILMTLSGTMFGWQVGWIVSLVGSMGSALIGFGACRRWGRPAFVRLVGPGEVDRIQTFFNRYGVWAILLSRSVPMLTEVISCLAGLSSMRFRWFTGLALAGTAPLCLVYAWAGHRALDARALGWAVLLAFVLPALGLLWMKVLHRSETRPNT